MNLAVWTTPTWTRSHDESEGNSTSQKCRPSSNDTSHITALQDNAHPPAPRRVREMKQDAEIETNKSQKLIRGILGACIFMFMLRYPTFSRRRD